MSGKCPIHHKAVETIEEETYFFRMSKYQTQLLKHIQEDKNFIVPENKRNEVLNRLTFEEKVIYYERSMSTFNDPHHSIDPNRCLSFGCDRCRRLLH